MDTSIPAFVGIPGGPELLIILAIAVLLFGANKLPSLARSSGQAMGEFKKGRQEIEEEIREAASDQEGTEPEAGVEETTEAA
jgi:sec-independent protein translocase protein TatA